MTCSVLLIPDQTAGLALDVSVDLPSVVAGDQVNLHVRGPKAYDVAATGSGSTFRFTADTTSWPAGKYWWSLRITSAGPLTKEAAKGVFDVSPDLVAAGDGFDGRSPNQIALDNIEAVIARRATVDQERYRINNRELYRTPIAQLIALRSHYKRLVAAECGKSRGRFGRNILVNFTS